MTLWVYIGMVPLKKQVEMLGLRSSPSYDIPCVGRHSDDSISTIACFEQVRGEIVGRRSLGGAKTACSRAGPASRRAPWH